MTRFWPDVWCGMDEWRCSIEGAYFSNLFVEMAPFSGFFGLPAASPTIGCVSRTVIWDIYVGQSLTWNNFHEISPLDLELKLPSNVSCKPTDTLQTHQTGWVDLDYNYVWSPLMKGWSFEHPLPSSRVSHSRDKHYVILWIYFVSFDYSNLTTSKQIITLTTHILMYFIVFNAYVFYCLLMYTLSFII